MVKVILYMFLWLVDKSNWSLSERRIVSLFNQLVYLWSVWINTIHCVAEQCKIVVTISQIKLLKL